MRVYNKKKSTIIIIDVEKKKKNFVVSYFGCVC